MRADIPDARLPELPLHQNIVDKVSERSDVPCGTCTLCCRTLIVPLALEEYEQYDWVWVCKPDGTRLSENARALKRKPNGDCVYLGDNGCTIHDRAPHVCARYSCADMFQKSDRGGRRASIKSGKLPKELWDKGREMAEFMGLKK